MVSFSELSCLASSRLVSPLVLVVDFTWARHRPAADDFEMGDDLVAVRGRAVGGVAAASCNVGPGIGVNCLADGCLEVEEDMVGDLEVADAIEEWAARSTFSPVMCPSPLSLTAMICPSFLSDVDVASRGGEGGLVREEGRAPPVAKEALRPQPTDGLRQLPRPSEESLPVSEVEAAASGGLHGGVQTCRTYAHVVHPDRRADVELSYVPPADGGNSITMEESDGDTD
ncbi:hypothetical protein Dimus_007955, partial [Dionaea muscipula]